MNIGAKLARRGCSLHGGYNLVANDEAADIAATRFLDKFLNQDVTFNAHKRLNYAFGSFLGFRQYHAYTLSTL